MMGCVGVWGVCVCGGCARGACGTELVACGLGGLCMDAVGVLVRCMPACKAHMWVRRVCTRVRGACAFRWGHLQSDGGETLTCA